MTDTLTLTTSSANADLLGQFAGVYMSGRITIGEITLVIPKRITWTLESVSDRVRLRPTGDVLVERTGIDVFLEFVDLFPSGEVFAVVKRFGVRITREVVT